MVDITYVQRKALTALEKVRAFAQLTRWREHVPYTIPLVIGGAMFAVQLKGIQLDWRLLAVVFANILAMAFAFMINDIEDAPDDALNENKKAHNVISSGILSITEGSIAAAVAFALSLILYAIGGWWAFGLGGTTLVLSYLYSAYPFRLKARPITDVVSHALMLSGLLVMSGYFTYDAWPGPAWLVIIGMTLFSAYGQFYNQVADYEVDKEAGLKNTVVLLGKLPTQILMYGSLAGAIITLIMAAFYNVFPAWLGTVTVITIFSVSLFVWETDMRGNRTEGSGALQKPGLLIANLVMLMWMAQELNLLFGL